MTKESSKSPNKSDPPVQYRLHDANEQRKSALWPIVLNLIQNIGIGKSSSHARLIPIVFPIYFVRGNER